MKKKWNNTLLKIGAFLLYIFHYSVIMFKSEWKKLENLRKTVISRVISTMEDPNKLE